MSSSLCRRLHGIFTTNTSLPSKSTSLTSTPKPQKNPNAVRKTPTSLPSTPKPQKNPNGVRKTPLNEVFKKCKIEDVVDKFKKFSEQSSFRRNEAIYFRTARRLAAAKKFSGIEEILEDQKKYKNITHEGFVVRLMRVYGESGMFDHAQKLFDEMPQLKCDRTVKSFNALLTACLNSKKFDKVEEIFREVLQKLSINPNVFSYTIVIKALCEMVSLESALSVLDEMESNGVNPDLITFNIILNGFYKNDRFSDGEKVWKTMESKGIVPCIWSYNAKLQWLVSHNRMPEAVELFEGLRTKGLKPDVFTLNTLIVGFCEGGDLDVAKKWYKELAENDCAPNITTFRMIVPFVCEMGDFGWGLKLCNEAFTCRWPLDTEMVQDVLDGLVKGSKVEEAKKLVEFIHKLDIYSHCELKLPLDE